VNEPVFLDFAVVEDIHHASLEMYGGTLGIRDRNLIESALGAAKNTFEYTQCDLFDIAATYAFHLAQAQAFLDGNKRTAVGTAYLFLKTNGVLGRPADLETHGAMIAIAEKRLDKAGLAELFRHAANSAS
jgi:death-on-curing protein